MTLRRTTTIWLGFSFLTGVVRRLAQETGLLNFPEMFEKKDTRPGPEEIPFQKLKGLRSKL